MWIIQILRINVAFELERACRNSAVFYLGCLCDERLRLCANGHVTNQKGLWDIGRSGEVQKLAKFLRCDN